MVRRSSPKSKHKKVETKKYNTKGKQQKTKNSGSGLSKLQSPSTKLKDSKPPIKESKNQLKRKVKVLVDKKDINKVFNLFLKLKKAIINPSLEYGYARTSSGNIVKLIRDKKNHLIFPEDLQKEGHKKGLHTVIHNHPKGTSPLASPEDIRSYAEYRIKYGISTNDKGTFRVKNNNEEAMSEKQLDSIEEKKIFDIKEEMSDDFHNHLKYNGVNWKEYKKEDKSKYDRELNDFVNEHVKKYVPMYRKALSPYTMEITFI